MLETDHTDVSSQ